MSDLHFIKIVDRITERLFKSAKNHVVSMKLKPLTPQDGTVEI